MHIDGVLEVLKNELKVKSDMVLAVAAMHDILEDPDKYSAEDLTKYFGEDISKAVQLLAKQKGQNVQDYLKAIDENEYASWLMGVMSKKVATLHFLPCQFSLYQMTLTIII